MTNQKMLFKILSDKSSMLLSVDIKCRETIHKSQCQKCIQTGQPRFSLMFKNRESWRGSASKSRPVKNQPDIPRNWLENQNGRKRSETGKQKGLQTFCLSVFHPHLPRNIHDFSISVLLAINTLIGFWIVSHIKRKCHKVWQRGFILCI